MIFSRRPSSNEIHPLERKNCNLRRSASNDKPSGEEERSLTREAGVLCTEQDTNNVEDPPRVTKTVQTFLFLHGTWYRVIATKGVLEGHVAARHGQVLLLCNYRVKFFPPRR